MHLLTAAFLVLSGMAALIYQVAWVRLLSLSMGSTSASVGTILAAFFLGMGIGSYLAGHITRGYIRNFTPYILLEAVIGLSGLALLPVFLNLDAIMALFPALGTEPALKFITVMGLLAVPTTCLGATFPVMAAILIRRHDEIGLRVGQLYSLNTAGAVLGAALSGFVFIPRWGLDGAIYIAFALNAVIVALGLYFNGRWTLPPLELRPPPPGMNDDRMTPLRIRALMVLFITGLAAIGTEIGWTKYLVIFTGSTIYGFSAILTIVLAGIAAGAWASKSYLESMQTPQLWLAAGLALLGLLLIFSRMGLSMVPPVNEFINHLQAASFLRQGAKYTVVFLLLFPTTFLFGALFPLSIKLYCGDLEGVRRRIGKAFAVNTVAGIIGSILTGFWLIPVYGTDASLTAMALIILILPFLFFTAEVRPQTRMALAVMVGCIVLGSWRLPHINYQSLIAAVDYPFDPDAQSGKDPEFLFLKEGKAGVISMVTYDGNTVKLQNNGLNESLLNMADPNEVALTESLLGLMPYFLHKAPKTGFVLGFGGGITTRALTLTELESIWVVELEPVVVEAVRAIAGSEIPALQDPRVRIDFNDARNTLLVEDRTYDLIISQPSHPWLAGASNVFSREFFQIAESRLKPGGIYAQWVNLFNMDATTLRAIFRAFTDVFPYGLSLINLDSSDLLLFGSAQPLVLDYDRIQARINRPGIRAVLGRYRMGSPYDLMMHFGLSRREMVAAAGAMQPNTDTNILAEVRLSAMDEALAAQEDPEPLLRQHYHLDLLPYLGTNAAEILSKQARYFLSRGRYDQAAFLMKQQKYLTDPSGGRYRTK